MDLRGTLNLICFGLIQILSTLVADGHLHPWSLRAATLVATPAVGLRVYRHFAPCNRWLRKVFTLFSLLANSVSLYEVSMTSPGWSVPSLATTCLKHSFIYIPCLECHLNYISSFIFCLEPVLTSDVTSQLHRGSHLMSVSLFLGFRFYFSKVFPSSWAFHA